VALAYVLATPNGPHRGALVVLDILSMASWVGIFWWVGIRLVATKWRTPFFSSWTISSLGFIVVGTLLDGGTHSPMSYFLVLPLLFAGLAYPPRTVVTLTGIGVVAAAVIGVWTPRPSLWAAAALATTMLVAGVLATSTALNRHHLITTLVDTANHDGLTGCMTRSAFYKRLEHESAMCRRYGGHFSVVVADLDNLKNLNDQYGHQAGDGALRAVGQALVTTGRATDLAGRLGGDEFALLLPSAGSVEAERMAKRLLAAIASGSPITMTASAGIAEWVPDEGPDDLLQRADVALYSAKRSGRNCYRVSLPPDGPATPAPARLLRPSADAG
jgi:diguanylate cyclase (GGDEF)-like protein